MRLPGVPQKKRRSGADAAAVAAVYGLGGWTPTYEEFVSLRLNVDDSLAALGFYSAVAATAAGGESIPDGWIGAAITNPLEAGQWRRWDLRRGLRR